MSSNTKGPEYIPSVLNTPMLNYRVYYMSAAEKLRSTLLSFAVGGAVGLAFYGNQFLDEEGNATAATTIANMVIFLLVGVLVSRFYLSTREESLRKKRAEQLTLQFRELLSALATSLSSGMNIQESLNSAYQDLILEYSGDAYIVAEVRELLNGLKNNVPLEDMLNFLGERSQIEDIRSFAVVFAMCYRKGGSLKDIVRRTSNIIGEKVEIRSEIETAITSNKTQLNVMMLIPVAMVVMMRGMSSTFAASFATITGVLGITAAIGMFFAAYKLGQRIMDVKG